MFIRVNRMTVLLNHEVEVHITHFTTINLKCKNMMKMTALCPETGPIQGENNEIRNEVFPAGYSPKWRATCSTNRTKHHYTTILQKNWQVI